MSDGARFVRPSLEQIPAGDPAPLLAAGVASLGLNEGLYGPFPSALEAMTAALPELNRYPGRGSAELVGALSARHGVSPARVIVGAGADALIGYVCQAVLDPGDEVVVPWPSFPSFVRDAQKRDAVPVTVPLVRGQVDLDAVRAAVTARTRLVFIATPNNPTGLTVPREELIELVRDLPEHVLPVVDEAYFDYLEPETRLDAITDLARAGDDVLVLRTFSKLYGLAGLRVGFGIGPAAVVSAMRKVQRGYDVSALAQVAALASLQDEDEVVRRRLANRGALESLVTLLQAHGLDPLAPSEANFVLVEIDADSVETAGHLLQHGVAVQAGAPFGASKALRIGAGPPDALALLDVALDSLGFSAS